jgi:hypothetical protein
LQRKIASLQVTVKKSLPPHLSRTELVAKLRPIFNMCHRDYKWDDVSVLLEKYVTHGDMFSFYEEEICSIDFGELEIPE